MLSLLVPQLVALEEAAGENSGPSPWWFGIFALAVLLGLLAITVIMGKGRPHS
jgi:MYXO-CTERM domain-containing protein